MKKTLFTVAILASAVSFAQVGINTPTPKATLDVVASPSDITKIDGLIAPRLTGNELKAKDNLYTTDQTGTIVYATAAANPTTSKTLNVTEPGYFYFDGASWVKIASGAATGTEPWFIENSTNPATANTQNIYQNGNVGLGNFATAKPLTRLDVRGAIRGGSPNAEEVDGSSAIGQNSIAVGNNNKVSGVSSAAFGDSNIVASVNAIVAGNTNTLSPSSSYSAVFGIQNNVDGPRSLVGGFGNVISGNGTAYNLVSGLNNNISPIAGVTQSVGNAVFGNSNQVKNDYSIVSGYQNIVSGDYNLVGGSGNSTSETSSSVSVLGSQNIANNSSYVGVLGSQNTVTNANLTFISGARNQVNSPTSFVSGADNIVNADASYATVFGLNNTIGGSGTSHYATSIGTRNISKGHVSTTIGADLIASTFGEIVLGRWNEITSTNTSTSWVGTDPILQVGIGSNETAKKNALTIYKDGKVQVNQLKGTGNAYACIDADGNLFRSTTPCTP